MDVFEAKGPDPEGTRVTSHWEIKSVPKGEACDLVGRPLVNATVELTGSGKLQFSSHRQLSMFIGALERHGARAWPEERR